MLSSAVNHLCRQCRHQFISMPMRCSRAVVSRPQQADVQLHLWLLNTPVRFKGHSHWQNIKSTKTAKDDQRQKITNRVLHRIRIAAREGGGTDPKINSQLARVLEEGKLQDVPNATMLESLRKLEKKDMKGSLLYVEGRGLARCNVIVEMYTDRPKRARQEVQSVLKRYGGSIGESGTAKPCFNFKGVIYVRNNGDKSMSKDEALEKAIEAGAEDVLEGFDDDERPSFRFLCDQKELHVVKKALDDSGLKTTTARLEFIPHTFTLLEGEALDIAGDMREALENVEDAVRVYDNIGMTAT